MAEPVILSYARGLLKEFPGVPEGTVDVNWAKQHHSLWLQDELSQAKGSGQVRPMATPAE